MSFLERIGQKLMPMGKKLYVGGKNVLGTVNRIGNKIMPYTDVAVGMASPYLATNPYGAMGLAGYAGLKGGLALTNKLENMIQAGEKIAKTADEIRKEGVGAIPKNLGNIIDVGKSGLALGKEFRQFGEDTGDLKDNLMFMREMGDTTIAPPSNRRSPPSIEN